MRNNTDRIEIDFIRMQLFAEHFRSHIARRSTCIQRLLAILSPRNPEISQSQIPLLIKHQIFRFDVPMENLLAVDIVNRSEDAGYEKLCLLFSEALDVGESAPQVCAGQQIHDEVKVVPIVEGTAHVGDERRGQSLQYLPLVEHVVHALLHDDECLAHLLHRVKLLGLVQLDLPHLPVPPFADNLDEVEVVSGQLALFLLGGVLCDLCEGVVQAGLLLGVVHLYHVR